MVETKKTYGAIEEGHNEHYDEKNTYYLNESRFDWNRFVRLVHYHLYISAIIYMYTNLYINVILHTK